MYVFPRHTKLSQAVVEVSPVVELLIVKFNVTTLSQPFIVWSVSVYVPVDVYVFPYHTKLSQAVAVVSEDAELLIVKSSKFLLAW